MTRPEYKVSRLIRAYSKSSGAMVREFPLSSIELESLRRIFKIHDSNDPMFECYELSPGLTDQIDPCVHPKPDWNFSEFAYFLETDAD